MLQHTSYLLCFCRYGHILAGASQELVIPMVALLVFVILFGIFAVEKPADKNLDEYIIKNPRHEKREEVLRKRAKEDKKPWLDFS